MATPFRVYADTSVYGGVFDAEFARFSTAFFDQVKSGRFRLVSSAVVEREIEDAPPDVQTFFRAIAPLTDEAAVTEAVLALRDAYLGAGILSERSSEDALHVALASCCSCTVLVS